MRKLKTNKDNYLFKEWVKSLPKNLQVRTNDYDLMSAWEGGLEPEFDMEKGEWHLASRNPQTGQLLKSPDHPTYDKMIEGEIKAGFTPTVDLASGKIRSFEKGGIVGGEDPPKKKKVSGSALAFGVTDSNANSRSGKNILSPREQNIQAINNIIATQKGIRGPRNVDEASDKYLELLDKYGNPSISKTSGLAKKLGLRNYYNPLTKTLNVKYIQAIPSELSHAIQHKEMNMFEMAGKQIKDFFATSFYTDPDPETNDFLNEYYGKPPRLPDHELTYWTPGSLEYEAHSILEPKIQEDFDNIKKKYEERAVEKKQHGGFVNGGDDPKKPKPTRQDSIDLLNNSRQVLNYYSQQGYEEYLRQPGGIKKETFHELNSRVNSNMTHAFESGFRPTTNKAGRDEQFRMSDYRKDIDANKYKQRELASSILDLRAPMGLYDKRIEPTDYREFSNNKENDQLFRDQISIALYNPLLVKPVDMLSPTERKQRVTLERKEYGYSRLAGDPISPTKPIASAPKPKPKPKVNIPQLSPTGINQLPINQRQATINIPNPLYEEGYLKQPWTGVPGLNIVSMHSKKTGKLEPVAIENREGKRIDYRKYKNSALPKGFQYPSNAKS